MGGGVVRVTVASCPASTGAASEGGALLSAAAASGVGRPKLVSRAPASVMPEVGVVVAVDVGVVVGEASAVGAAPPGDELDSPQAAIATQVPTSNINAPARRTRRTIDMNAAP